MLRFSSAERCQIFWLIYPEWSVLLIEKVSLCNNFYLLRCSIKCAFEDTQRHLVMSQNLKFFPNYFFLHFQKRNSSRRKTKNQRPKYTKNQKRYWDEMKHIFHNFWKTFKWKKKRKKEKRKLKKYAVHEY